MRRLLPILASFALVACTSTRNGFPEEQSKELALPANSLVRVAFPGNDYAIRIENLGEHPVHVETRRDSGQVDTIVLTPGRFVRTEHDGPATMDCTTSAESGGQLLLQFDGTEVTVEGPRPLN